MNKENRNALLSDIYDFQYGMGNTIENIGGDYPIYGSNGAVGFTNIFNSEDAPVIGHIGAYAGIVNWATGKHFVTYNGVICRIKKGIHPRFGYYLLLHSKLQKRLRGSTQPFVSYDLLYEVKVFLPDTKTQNNIASVLTALDSKIELNNRINAELEAMAKTLYDYWFVQFDFPDKNGKPYKTSGGKMVWNEELKREIPDRWEVKQLRKIESNIVTGKTPLTDNKDFYNGEIPFITIGDIRGNMHVTSTEITLSKSGADSQVNKYIPKGSLCVTCIASPGLIGFATKNSQTNQQINSIVFHNDENRTYLYFALNDYFKFAKGAKTGNTFANMNKGDFESIQLVLPENKLRLKFEEFALPIVELILMRSKENKNLSELRDWLLPMLMNGQVKVN